MYSVAGNCTHVIAGVGAGEGVGVGTGVAVGVAVGSGVAVGTGVGVGTCWVGSGVTVAVGGLILRVTNRSATILTVPNAPLWLSTPPQVIWEPGVELASIVTLVLIAYLPS